MKTCTCDTSYTLDDIAEDMRGLHNLSFANYVLLTALALFVWVNRAKLLGAFDA